MPVVDLLVKIAADARAELARIDGEIALLEQARTPFRAVLAAIDSSATNVTAERAGVTQLRPRRSRTAARSRRVGRGRPTLTRWQQVRAQLVLLGGTASVAALADRTGIPQAHVSTLLSIAKRDGLISNNSKRRTWSLLPGKPVEIPRAAPAEAASAAA
jgi:hypothetical protein